MGCSHSTTITNTVSLETTDADMCVDYATDPKTVGWRALFKEGYYVAYRRIFVECLAGLEHMSMRPIVEQHMPVEVGAYHLEAGRTEFFGPDQMDAEDKDLVLLNGTCALPLVSKVVVYKGMRIAHLIEDEDVRPYKILAITFTNKAAHEMKDRIEKMLGEQKFNPTVSTIHSLCVRILREDIQHMGYPKNFTIMDADDQKSVVKEACKQLNIDNSNITPSGYIDYISNNKAGEVGVEEAKKMAGQFTDDLDKVKVYAYYLERQKQLSALDFDDLIAWTVKMFKKFPEVMDKWQRRFEYVLVDEFQDIDRLQYTLIKQLAGKDSSIYVVGDPDQTIYTWRGADVNIIMDFHKDFPDAKTIILNENYRSTSAILNTANSVIANNVHRMKKDLYTSRKSDAKVTHYLANNDEYQAAWIAGKIYDLHKNGLAYHEPENTKDLNDLLTLITVAQSETAPSGSKCEGLTFVVTGDVHHYKNRNELKAYIESQGGKVTGSVSKSTNYLINNDVNSTSSKNTTAKSLNIPILSEDDFVEKFDSEMK